MNYIALFKIKDNIIINISISNIVRNHNLDDLDKDLFKRAHHLCTHQPLDLMLFDFRSNDAKHEIRHNFTNFLDSRPKQDQMIKMKN